MSPTDLTPFERDQVYNGLDCCVTHDVFTETHSSLDNTTASTYDFSKSLQGPVLDMRIRGVLIDQARRQQVITELYSIMDIVEAQLDRIVQEGCNLWDFNWRSPKSLQALFYDTLGLPTIRKMGRPTVDRGAREELALYPIAVHIVNHINLLTELGDKVSVLKTSVDPDGRIRTSYNIAGTNTGRFSSSISEFGTGGNLQNVEESLRSIFIADQGYKLAKCDAKSGESFCVGAIEWNLFRDSRYLDACETGDPHTAVARICWPQLPWTGNLKADKALAETPYYRHYTYRFMCKKLGHGSNYGGQPETLAAQAKLPITVVMDFQPKYFRAFPAHLLLQANVEQTLRREGKLTTLTGRRRSFFGRRSDADTLRAAIAYDPQGSLADIVNTAMLKIWRTGRVAIMLHDHDALTFMYPEEMEDEIIPWLMKELIVPIDLAGGRQLQIPYDCKVGWNKGEYCCGERRPECKECKRPANIDGLKDYQGHDKRERTPQVGILDRELC